MKQLKQFYCGILTDGNGCVVEEFAVENANEIPASAEHLTRGWAYDESDAMAIAAQVRRDEYRTVYASALR